MTEQICIMTSVHRHDDVRIYHKEAKALRQKGFSVTILCPDYAGTDENGICFVRVPMPKKRLQRILTASRRFYKAAKETGADWFHFHDPELLGAGKRLMRCGRVIYDVHEDVPRQILNKPYLKPWIAKLVSRFFERREMRIAKKLYGIVAAVPAIYDRLRTVCRNTALVCNYPNLAEFEETDWIPPEQRENSVCYVGGITEIRGLFEMLDAVAGTEIKLILAGDFETKALYERAKQHPGWGNVEYLGFLGRKEVCGVLQRAKAGLVTLHPIPQYLISLPVKMFEYMTAQLPVIASDFSYWNEIVDDAQCGVCVDPLKPEEIRKAIEYIIRHPDTAREMGASGKKAVFTKYNWENEAQKLFLLYRCEPEESIV